MHNFHIKQGLCLFITSFLIIVGFGLYNSHGINTVSFLYLVTAGLVQSAIFCIPIFVLYKIGKVVQNIKSLSIFLKVASYFYTVLGILILVSNYKLFSMYGYFVNSFVLNILLTPGGIEAMGVSRSSYISSFLLFVLIAGAVFVYIKWMSLEKIAEYIRHHKHKALSFLTLLFIFQVFGYAYADYKNIPEILNTSDKIVWHVKATMKSAFTKMGIEGTGRKSIKVVKGKLNYPQKPFESLKIKEPYNIVWLVAESWRSDMLDKRIMPKTYSFGQKNTQFLNHYSSGNGTRMGMFGQFYGLYGFYWFNMLAERKSPVLFDILINNNYTKKAFTSARFSYPEFDKTLFSEFSKEELQSYSHGEGWERDRKNVTDLIDFMRQAKEPFFSFMFFESAHANYYFPEESVIEKNYLENFDYLVTDIPKNIVGIKNRYINASHHLDSQLNRVFDYLEKENKLDNTIVIVTGDHGEEFLEKNRWGHNSTFSQEQIRVPLIIHHPKLKMQPVKLMTSHLDMPATILAFLGINDDPSQYSFGQNLYSKNYVRDSLVVSDWSGSALVTSEIKYSLSNKVSSESSRVTTVDDAVNKDGVTPDTTRLLSEYIQSTGNFYSK